jgi:hypothetical protein
MYTPSKRFIAFILLFSHSLMSCFVNQPAGTGKEDLARIAQKINKKHKTELSVEEAKALPGSSLVCTTADGQEVSFSYQQDTWQADIKQVATPKHTAALTKNVPVLFEPGYQLADISPTDLGQQKQFVHIIRSKIDEGKIDYVYIGKEAISIYSKCQQPDRSPTLPAAALATQEDKKLEIDFYQHDKKGLVSEKVNQQNKSLFIQPSDNQLSLQNKQTHLQPQPKIAHTHKQNKVKKTTSKNVSNPIQQQSELKVNQGRAKTQRIHTDEKTAVLDKQTIQETVIPQTKQALAILQPTENTLQKELKELPILIANKGHRVQFTTPTCEEAIVDENVAKPLTRKLLLHVIKQDPTTTLHDLLAHSKAWHEHHLYVIFPEHTADDKGYVLITNKSEGLCGGGNSINVGDYVTCNTCGNPARVTKNITTDRVLWVNLGHIYYSCEYCAQRRRAREARERERERRQEEERIREEAQRREQERRRMEEERRQQEEELKAKKQQLEKELAEIKKQEEKIKSLSGGLNRAKDNTQKIKNSLEELDKTAKENQKIEQTLSDKFRLSQGLTEQIKKTHERSEILEEHANKAQREIQNLGSQRGKTQQEIDKYKVANQATENRIKAIQNKIQGLQATINSRGIGTPYPKAENEREINQLENEIQLLEKDLYQAQQLLNQQQAGIKRLQQNLIQQVNEEEKGRKNLEHISATLLQVKEEKRALDKLATEAKDVQHNQDKITQLLKKLTEIERNSVAAEDILSKKNKVNNALAEKIRHQYALEDQLTHQIYQAQVKLQELSARRVATEKQKTQAEVANKQQQIKSLTSEIKVLETELERKRTAVLAGNPNLNSEDRKKLNTIAEKIQILQKTLVKEEKELAQQEESAKNLEKAFQEQIQEEEQRKEALDNLEKDLTQLHKENQNIELLSGALKKALNQQQEVEDLSQEIEKTWHTNKNLEETLRTYQKENEAIYQKIKKSYAEYGELADKLYHQAENITQQRQQVQSEKEQIDIAIKHQRRQIEILTQQIKELETAQDKKREELLSHQGRTSSTNTTENQEKEIAEQIQLLHQKLKEQQDILQKQQLLAQYLQEILNQRIQQERERKDNLIQLQNELHRNQEIEAEIEKLIDEDLKEALKQGIADDKRVEDLLRKLRKEESLVKERATSQRVIEELTKHVELEEEKIYADHIRKREAEQAHLAAESADLRNTCSARRADLERQLHELAEEEIANEAAYQARTNAWEENNQRKCKEEAESLLAHRRAAEEARKIAEEGRRELERQKAAARRNKKEKRGFWGTLWDGVKKVGTAVVDGVKWAGEKIVKGAGWLGDKLWKCAKWLGEKIWKGAKKVGKWIWEHKWDILKVIGIVAITILAIWGIGVIIAKFLLTIGVGSGEGILGWLMGTTVGKFVLGGISWTAGWLQMNRERIENFRKGYGWYTNAERKEKEEEKERLRQQGTSQQQSSEQSSSNTKSSSSSSSNGEGLRRRKPAHSNTADAETRRQQQAPSTREKTKQDRPTDRPETLLGKNEGKFRHPKPNFKGQKDEQRKQEEERQTEDQRKQEEEQQREKQRKQEEERQKEEQKKKQEEHQKEEQRNQEEERQTEDQRKQEEERQREEQTKHEEKRKKKEDIRKGKEKIDITEEEPGIDEETPTTEPNEEEPLLPEEKKEKPSTSWTEGISNFFKNAYNQFTKSFNQPGPAQQQENAKVAKIQECANQAQDILEQYQETGSTPALQEEAQALLEDLEELIQQEENSQEVLQNLSNGYVNSPELQADLDRRLKEIAGNLEKLKETRDNLTEHADLLPETDDSIGEDTLYEDLTKYFKNSYDAAELATNGQQEVDNLLKQLSNENKEALKEQAQELRDALGSLMGNMQSQHAHIQELYRSDVSDYLEQNMDKGEQDLKSLENSMKCTQATLDKLCETFNLEKPDLTPQPLISKEVLKTAFNTVLDATVPGSELIKVILGTTDKPETLEECLKLAVNTVLDFIPGGKAMKVFKGAATKLGVKKLEKQLLKEAKKIARKLAREQLRKLREAKKANKDAKPKEPTTGTSGENIKNKSDSSKQSKGQPKEWNGKYKKKKPGVSGKEGAKNPPEWAKECRPREGESGKEFAKRIMDEKYGAGKYDPHRNREFSKIKKWADRAFE